MTICFMYFEAGAYNLVELNSKKNPKSYYFSFEYSPLWLEGGSDAVPGGVGHSDTLIYLFQRNPLILPNDLTVSNKLIDLLVNFATYDGYTNALLCTIAFNSVLIHCKLCTYYIILEEPK